MYMYIKIYLRKRTAAAAERNKEPILEVLKKYISNTKAYFLEISSGTGQHVAHFAPHFPNLTFQPSEYDKDMLSSIQAWGQECPTQNVSTIITNKYIHK